MCSFWLSNLQSLFGEDRVEDALEGTALADLGREHNFGLYVVRAAIAADAAKEWMQQSKIDIEAIAANAQNQQRAVALQGSSKKRKLYNTVQACAGGCRCMYIYEGTARHKVYGLDQVESIKRVHQWLHGSAVVPSTHMFNEATLNVYSHEANQNIPWHSDKNDLYSDEMDVMAMNLGAPGLYCFGPRRSDYSGQNRTIWPQLGRKYCTWRQSAIEEGVRGMLPVRAGDLTLTTGTWHLHFDHKTQKPASIWSGNRGDLLSSYPATSAASRNLFLRLEMPDDITLRDRACITFRRIEHHIEQCTYETALRSFSCASASSASVGAVLRRHWSPC